MADEEEIKRALKSWFRTGRKGYNELEYAIDEMFAADPPADGIPAAAVEEQDDANPNILVVEPEGPELEFNVAEGDLEVGPLQDNNGGYSEGGDTEDDESPEVTVVGEKDDEGALAALELEASAPIVNVAGQIEAAEDDYEGAAEESLLETEEDKRLENDMPPDEVEQL